MASGDTIAVFTPLSNEPPAAAYATFDTRNAYPTLDFDDTTEEKAVFTGIIPNNWGSSGITGAIWWTAGTAAAGTVVWQMGFEKVNTDIDADSFVTGINGTTVTGTVSGIPNTTSIAVPAGTAMDSLAVGDLYRVYLTREVGDAQDAMGGDAEFLGLELKET